MFSFVASTSLLLLSVVQGSPTRLHNLQNRGEGIQWGPCNFETGEVPVQCGKLAVPLDYTDENNCQTIDLDLIKLPATQQPAKGSILLNFGGPGGDGLHNMLSYGVRMAP
jgi:hypothetical protein